MLEQRQAEIAHAESKLAALNEQFGEAALRHQGESRELAETEEKLHVLQSDIQGIAGETRRLDQLRAEIASVSGELKDKQSQSAKVQEEVARLKQTSTRLRNETNDLEVKAQKYQTVRNETARLEKQAGELQSAQTKLKGVEDRLGEARIEETELAAEIKKLREKKKTLRRAPDLEWGTIHMFSRTIISRIDMIDELIIRADSISSDNEVEKQFGQMRTALLDALAEHGVEPFSYSSGSKIDDANRDRIEIVNGGPGKEQVSTTLKPGFICRNGDDGKPTVLRKAEVQA